MIYKWCSEKLFVRTWKLLDASVSGKNHNLSHCVSGGNAAVVIVNHSWIKALEPKLDARGILAKEILTDRSLLFHTVAVLPHANTHTPPPEFCVLSYLHPLIALFIPCQCFGKTLLHWNDTSREKKVIAGHGVVETFVSSPRFSRNFRTSLSFIFIFFCVEVLIIIQ